MKIKLNLINSIIALWWNAHLNCTCCGLCFTLAKQVPQIYFYGCIVLSLSFCAHIDNGAVWEQEVLFLCCCLELLSFVLVMGARCQSIKRSWNRQKDCHSDLLLNSKALALFCLLWKSNIHKHVERNGANSFPFVEAVTAEERWLLGTSLEWGHLLLFSKLCFDGGGQKERERRKEKNL